MASIKNRRDELLSRMEIRLRVVGTNNQDKPYVISAWMPGTTTANELLINHRLPITISIPTTFIDSSLTCGVQPTADTTFTITNGTALVGQAVFYTAANFYAGSYYYQGSSYYIGSRTYRSYSGSNGAVFYINPEYSGDERMELQPYTEISLIAPAVPDATLANLTLTLKANR